MTTPLISMKIKSLVGAVAMTGAFSLVGCTTVNVNVDNSANNSNANSNYASQNVRAEIPKIYFPKGEIPVYTMSPREYFTTEGRSIEDAILFEQIENESLPCRSELDARERSSKYAVAIISYQPHAEKTDKFAGLCRFIEVVPKDKVPKEQIGKTVVKSITPYVPPHLRRSDYSISEE